MLKWAHNPALRPNCQPKMFESKQNPEETSSYSLWSEKHGNGRRVQEHPKEKLSGPGRRRSLGSLLAKEPMTKNGQTGIPVKSLVLRKPSLGMDGGRAPLATPDAFDRNLKTLSLTRTTDGFGRDVSFLKESPLKRSKERAGLLFWLKKDVSETLSQVSHLVPWPSPILDSESDKEGFTGVV